jgi:hypothetical protein
MGVPAHDSRDSILAEVQGLPVLNVIDKTADSGCAETDGNSDGVMLNSGDFNGMRTVDARKAIGEELKVRSHAAMIEDAGVGADANADAHADADANCGPGAGAGADADVYSYADTYADANGIIFDSIDT